MPIRPKSTSAIPPGGGGAFAPSDFRTPYADPLAHVLPKRRQPHLEIALIAHPLHTVVTVL